MYPVALSHADIQKYLESHYGRNRANWPLRAHRLLSGASKFTTKEMFEAMLVKTGDPMTPYEESILSQFAEIQRKQEEANGLIGKLEESIYHKFIRDRKKEDQK